MQLSRLIRQKLAQRRQLTYPSPQDLAAFAQGRMVKVIPSNASAAGMICQQCMSGSRVSHLVNLVTLIRQVRAGFKTLKLMLTLGR